MPEAPDTQNLISSIVDHPRRQLFPGIL